MKRNHRILVVGDSLTANVMQQLVLEDAGYFVVAALGVSLAMEAAKHSFFGIAVVDGSLPPEDVKKLLVTLRALSVPSLLVAPHAVSEEIKSLADAYIPFQDSFMLTQLVASLLHNSPTAMRKAAVPPEAAAVSSGFDSNTSISARLQNVTKELRHIQDLLTSENEVDPRILTDLRDTLNRVRNTAWAVERYLSSNKTETDS